MKKIKLFSLVSTALIGLTLPVWAGPQGGGRGFTGGHFGGGGGFRGGGFRGGALGGFHATAPVSGDARAASGVRTRGGGVGFGIPQLQSGVSHSARNRGAMPSTARPSQTFPQRGLNGTTDHIFARHDANWHRDWDRRHAHFHNGHFFVFINGFWCGLDAGFFPWDYLPYYAYDYYPYDYYADVQPYDNTEADYNGVPVANATVQAVQTQLTQLGYYTGPVDGIFGPATRDALAKYQIANQLNVTGSLSPDTLQSLGLPQVTPS
jgi:hypothetical protein